MTTVPGTYFTKEQLEVDLKGNGYYYFFYTLILIKLMYLLLQLMIYQMEIALIVRE
jgi:hypothetical protein